MKNLEKIWNKIGSVTKDEVVRAVLNDEIENATSNLQPRDTGHLHDYIARLNHRLEEMDPYAG